ncbi:YqeG family HAD IIIA-type phosphatase [Caldicellulosiruptoraceae bacterium PP1]
MKDRFKPDIICNTIFDIDIERLKKNGIKYLIIDIDNTIVPWGEYDITKRTFEWIENLLKEGFKVCLVSNNKKDRVQKIEKLLNVPAIYSATKPLKRGFLKAAKLLNGLNNKEKVAVIGDQFFTDVIGAKRIGFYAILVRPLKEKEFIVTKINRILEKKIIKHYLKDGSK